MKDDDTKPPELGFGVALIIALIVFMYWAKHNETLNPPKRLLEHSIRSDGAE